MLLAADARDDEGRNAPRLRDGRRRSHRGASTRRPVFALHRGYGGASESRVLTWSCRCGTEQRFVLEHEGEAAEGSLFAAWTDDAVYDARCQIFIHVEDTTYVMDSHYLTPPAPGRDVFAVQLAPATKLRIGPVRRVGPSAYVIGRLRLYEPPAVTRAS